MPTISSLLAPLVAPFVLFSIIAAADVPICSNIESQWSYNSIGQSPCEMASYLKGVCDPSGINPNISTLTDGYCYTAGDPGSANDCACSTVVYSLLSACTICQPGRSFHTWSDYSLNCNSTQIHISTFPADIPSGTKIPHWAYLDVTLRNNFSASVAQDSLNAPESTAVSQTTTSFGSLTSLTSSTSFSSLTSLTGPTASVQDSGKKSDAGAIAGGVVGGLALLAVVGGLLFWWVQRHKKATTTAALVTLPTPMHMEYSHVTLNPGPSPPWQKPNMRHTSPRLDQVRVPLPTGVTNAPSSEQAPLPPYTEL